MFATRAVWAATRGYLHRSTCMSKVSQSIRKFGRFKIPTLETCMTIVPIIGHDAVSSRHVVLGHQEEVRVW